MVDSVWEESCVADSFIYICMGIKEIDTQTNVWCMVCQLSKTHEFWLLN